MCHTGNRNRFGIFQKNSPYTTNFLGYPGTSGSDFDYIVADKVLILKINKNIIQKNNISS